MITTEQLFDGRPRDMTPERVRVRYEKACQMVADLCKPKTHPEHRDWTMSIPARPDYDPDLVIRDSLDDIPTLLERLEAAEARAERAEAELARLRSVVEAAEAFVRATRGLFGGTVDVFSPDVAERTWERMHEALVALDAAREEAHGDA
ncbi:MAG TPA: hypothetical protein VK052_06450 [Zeimonas sp.]|nr:hypothetical protein [Zeimonas sp.]